MKMLNMTSWTYVGYAAFPNIDNNITLEEMGLDIDDDKFKVYFFLLSEHFYIYFCTR